MPKVSYGSGHTAGERSADIQDLIDELESLGTSAEEIAREAAPEIEKALKAKTAAGVDINGKSFAATKEGRAYTNVASAISVTSSGTSIVTSLSSPSNGAFFQNRMSGDKDNRPRRQVLPITKDDPEPKEAMEVIERVIERVRARKLGG